MENQTAANASEGCSPQADFQYFLFPVIYILVFVLGLLENGAALYLLIWRISNPPRSYIYLVNLAVVDTLFACVLPFKIHYHLHHNNWIFGDMACRITGSMYFLNIYLSVAFFTSICVDRYVAVLHPLAYVRIKRVHYALVSAILWVTGLSVAGSLVLGGPLDANISNARVCFESFGEASWKGRMLPYNVCVLVFGFVVPFVVILISYPLIARRISHISHSACRRKALSTIYLILFICVTCFLPFHLTHLLHFLARAGLIQNCRFATTIYKLRRVTLALVSFNCCLNPVLYYYTLASKQCHWQLCWQKGTSKVCTISGGHRGHLNQTPALWGGRWSSRAANKVTLMVPPRKLADL
ncbi:lysophosphatidic acid receptor 6-like [Python bivittatus]|uniref:Lysophosphatidic acid receptor 6-like n=1 Tax=Python bivittatus TaxID=176946 RepID=A0A9F2WIZ7_PYTBI|nr:lysophosphatidic acid receptor 6-like [Python bivittatus]